MMAKIKCGIVIARGVSEAALDSNIGHSGFSACGAELRRFAAKNPHTAENDREKFSRFGSEPFTL
jgi:hypothetical protein